MMKDLNCIIASILVDWYCSTNLTTIFVFFTLKKIWGSKTKTIYKPTFKTSSVYNNKEIQPNDEWFEAYHRFCINGGTLCHRSKNMILCINILVLITLKIRFVFLYIVLLATRPMYKTFTVDLYNNKEIRCDDEGFEVYQRFHSGWQILYHQFKNTIFGIVHFRKRFVGPQQEPAVNQVYWWTDWYVFNDYITACFQIPWYLVGTVLDLKSSNRCSIKKRTNPTWRDLTKLFTGRSQLFVSAAKNIKNKTVRTT